MSAVYCQSVPQRPLANCGQSDWPTQTQIRATHVHCVDPTHRSIDRCPRPGDRLGPPHTIALLVTHSGVVAPRVRLELPHRGEAAASSQDFTSPSRPTQSESERSIPASSAPSPSPMSPRSLRSGRRHRGGSALTAILASCWCRNSDWRPSCRSSSALLSPHPPQPLLHPPRRSTSAPPAARRLRCLRFDAA